MFKQSGSPVLPRLACLAYNKAMPVTALSQNSAQGLEGEEAHCKEGVPGILQDPALRDCVGNFILWTESADK